MSGSEEKKGKNMSENIRSPKISEKRNAEENSFCKMENYHIPEKEGQQQTIGNEANEPSKEEDNVNIISLF